MWGSRRKIAALALVGGLGLVGLAFVLPQILGPPTPNAAVVISQPLDGQEVKAGKPLMVRVVVQGASIASSPTAAGGHLHLYVDGKLQQMPYATSASVILDRGTHLLRVEYVDHLLVSYSPAIAATVRVTAT